MTLLDKLQAHKGGLIHIKSQLYWYGCGGWDNNPGRICLILDTTTTAVAAAFLLIDGQPHWVWVAEEDIELLVNDPPTN